MVKRYVMKRVPLGVLIIDRRAGSWALCSGRTVIDYGKLRDTAWTRYTPQMVEGK